jgi:hypothetical protein
VVYKTYRTGKDGHIADFPGIFKLQELPTNMTPHSARASYDEISEARHEVCK